MKVAVWIIAGSCALLALGVVVLPFGMGVAAGMDHKPAVAAQPTADEVFKSVAESM